MLAAPGQSEPRPTRPAPFQDRPVGAVALDAPFTALRDRSETGLLAVQRAFTARARSLGMQVHAADTAAVAAAIAAGIGATVGARLAYVDRGRAVREITPLRALAEQAIQPVQAPLSEAERGELAHSGMQLVSGCLACAESVATFIERPVASIEAKVTVVVLAIDRIAATEAELRATLSLLPAAPVAVAPDGSRQHGRLHLILLDNGRQQMALDASFRPALRCIDCTACANVCTPLSAAGTTPIGLIQSAWQRGLHADASLDACLLCGDCAPACPVAIPLPELILELRSRRTAPAGARVRPAARGRLERWLARRSPPPATHFETLSMMIQRRDGRSPESPRLRTRLSPRERQGAVLLARAGGGALPRSLRVAYVAGCVVDELMPETGMAAIELLQGAGCEVVLPPRLQCCGMAQIARGERQMAAERAAETVAALSGARVDAVVFSSPACAAAVRQHYPRLLHGSRNAREGAAVAARTVTLSEILDRLTPAPPARNRAAVHAGCGFARLAPEAPVAPHLVTPPSPPSGSIALTDACCGFDAACLAPSRARLAAAESLFSRATAAGAPELLVEDAACLDWLRRAATNLRPMVLLRDLTEARRSMMRESGG